MVLIIESVILCVIFTLLIVIPLSKNPIGQIMSYPLEIRKRVEELPQYKDNIKITKKKHIIKKTLSVFLFAIVLAYCSCLSGANNFKSVLIHSFILFFVVNIYDLIVLDIILFPNIKRFRIPGTEDMEKEYRNPKHHIIGALFGSGIGLVCSILSASIVYLFGR